MTAFRSVVSLFAQMAAGSPTAEAVVHGARRVTYEDLWRGACAVSGFLRTNGVRPGHRVAVILENSPEYIAAYYGALTAGAMAVGLNHAARARELTRWVEHCDAGCLIVDARHPDFRELVEHAAARLVVVVGEAQGGTSWESVLQSTPGEPSPVAEGTPAAIIYTSGTTGRPKGVTLTHGNLAANARAIVEYLGLSSADRVVNVLPFSYSYGSSVLHTHLTTGATLILENSLVYPSRVLSRIAEERATGFPGVPSTFALLLQSSDLARTDLSSLRYVTQAGGAMPRANIARLCGALPGTRIFIMYGQTEATARLCYLPPELLNEKIGSVGIPVAGMEVQVLKDDGTVATAHEIGEVRVRGTSVMLGYFNDPGATAAVLREGWLYTGDLGYRDADGFLYLQGRRSDMIKSGAHRISPADIEDVIATLPEVEEAAVIGVPDEMLGEAIKAIVRVRPGATLEAMAVQRHCHEQLPRYKVPRIVEFVDALPRTSSGKIMRYRLAAH
jgi:acyl-CoA synthetase (AMP-forming)/AMP-acid ligase II